VRLHLDVRRPSTSWFRAEKRAGLVLDLFLNPCQVTAKPVRPEVLRQRPRHLGRDHRFPACAARLGGRKPTPESRRFATRDRSNDVVDWRRSSSRYFRQLAASGNYSPFHSLYHEDPENVPDEITIALVRLARPRLAPCSSCIQTREAESEKSLSSCEFARPMSAVLKLLLDRMEFDVRGPLLLARNLRRSGGTAGD